MRMLRIPLLAMVALLSALEPVAAAQEEPSPITFVTGTVAEVCGYDDATGASDLASHDVGGYEVTTQSGAPIREVVEWSDPRLPTDLWLSLGYTLVSQGVDRSRSDGAMNAAWQTLLQDEQGSWRGTGRSVQSADAKYSLYALSGGGAYEGLSALLWGTAPDDVEAGLVHANAPWDMAYEGYIFEADLTSFRGVPTPLETGAFQLWPVPTE
jgi:hypothetical protein